MCIFYSLILQKKQTDSDALIPTFRSYSGSHGSHVALMGLQTGFSTGTSVL